MSRTDSRLSKGKRARHKSTGLPSTVRPRSAPLCPTLPHSAPPPLPSTPIFHPLTCTPKCTRTRALAPVSKVFLFGFLVPYDVRTMSTYGQPLGVGRGITPYKCYDLPALPAAKGCGCIPMYQNCVKPLLGPPTSGDATRCHTMHLVTSYSVPSDHTLS